MNDSSIKDLYNTLILKHYKKPYHRNKEIQPNHSVHSKNESCGDEVTIYFTFDEGQNRIKKASFNSKGCIICQASASILAKYIEGKEPAVILTYIKNLHRLIEKNKQLSGGKIKNKIDEVLHALAYVREFPTRTQCVLLSWNALEGKLQEFVERDADKDTD